MIDHKGHNDVQEKFIYLSQRSVLYQSLKYLILTLNIFLVSTCSIISIIVCLIPSAIIERKNAVEKAINSLQSGNISQVIMSTIANSSEDHQHDSDSGRFIRYLTLVAAILVIFNQTLNVFGLFHDQICIILVSSIFLAIIGQIGLFVLPNSAFILILIFIIACILLIVEMANLKRQVRESLKAKPFNASYRKAATCESCRNSFPAATKPMPTQYYGSLGRRPQESRIFYPHYHPQSIQSMDWQPASGSLRASNKFHNLSVDQNRNIYANLQPVDRRMQYEIPATDRTSTSTML